jgi:hypothetical protein
MLSPLLCPQSHTHTNISTYLGSYHFCLTGNFGTYFQADNYQNSTYTYTTSSQKHLLFTPGNERSFHYVDTGYLRHTARAGNPLT